MFRHLDNFLKVIFILLPLSVLVALFVTDRYAESLASTHVELRERAIHRNIELIENVARQIQAQLNAEGALPTASDPSRRERFESLLRVAQLSDIQFLYAVYKDAEGDYRFWLDAESDATQRSEYGQYFTPASDIWDRVYETRCTARTGHESFESLWITVAAPVMHAGEVVAVIGADISYNTETAIAKDMHSFYTLSSKITVLLVALLLLIFVVVLFYGERRSRSFRDPLTGAYNRAFFHEVIVKRFDKGYRVMIFDIDHFKKINDAYGHVTGDKVLKQLSARMRKHIRRDDYFVRFGGEEFLLFIHERRGDEARQLAQRLLALVAAAPFDAGGKQIDVTVSIGLNLAHSEQGTVDDAVKRADEALYRAKSMGRNRVEVAE